jgi:hypothetical protein
MAHLQSTGVLGEERIEPVEEQDILWAPIRNQESDGGMVV